MKLLCKLFGHAHIPAIIRDECDEVICPRCGLWMTVETYEMQLINKWL